MLSIFISALSLAMSVVALLASYRIYRLSRADTNRRENIMAMLSIEGRLQDYPSMLRFHGIDEADLEKLGITPKEFAYLLNNFSVGRLGYLDGGLSSSGTFKAGSYRHTMLKNPDVQKAWPLLRLLISPGPYRDAIDRTINQFASSCRPTDPGDSDL